MNGMRRAILAVVLLAACGHGVTLDVAQQRELTALACDADRACRQHANFSDENWPLMPAADGACVNLVRTWLLASGNKCEAAK